MTCKGLCKQCKSSITVAISWPVNKIARCVCFVTNIDASFSHIPDKKIKLSPAQRVEISTELKHISAITYRNKLANEIMQPDDAEPPHMPTVGWLRQIKYEENKSSYYETNPVLSSSMMTRVTP